MWLFTDLSSVALAIFLPCVAQSQQQSEKAYSPPRYPSPWMSPTGEWESAYLKAKDFVSQLTLLEKVNLTTGIGYLSGRCLGQTGSIPRLGFDGLCLQDTPLNTSHADFSSGFPQGHLTGATWDRGLSYARGLAMGQEFKKKGADLLLRPVCSPLGRFPEGGRNSEGFGSDPYLCGEMIGPSIQGIQEAGIMATVKHYLANEQEHFRYTLDAEMNGFNVSESLSANIDDRTMHEIYLWPFYNAVKAGSAAVMGAYNQINNSYACSNSYVLNHLLKTELGFQGFVMTDWGAHHGGVSTALAGLDMSMPGDGPILSGSSFFGNNLTVAVLNGTMPEWRLDDMCMRIMAAFFQVGRDKDRNPPNFSSFTTERYAAIPLIGGTVPQLVNEYVPVREDHWKLNREIATAGITLLKNTGSLPLTGKERQVAIIGSDAGSNSWGANGCPDKGCDRGTLTQQWGSGSFLLPYLITPADALTNYIVTNTVSALSTITDDYAHFQIRSLVSQATTALVFVNANSGEGYITVEGNYGDRNNLTLWHNGTDLVDAVASQCNDTIVIMHTAGPIIPTFHNNPNVTGILWAGLPGSESGPAITSVLYGQHNPSGKLPFTMANRRADYGPSVLYEPNNGAAAPQQDLSGLDLDYRHFDIHNITPVYEFGFGLSYTTFTYSDLTIIDLHAPAYMPNNAALPSAPTLNPLNLTHANLSNYQTPAEVPGQSRYPTYIYPYLTSTNLSQSSRDLHYGLDPYHWLPENALSTAAPKPHPAGGASGGNPLLWVPVLNVSLTVTNSGNIDGHEVVQLYLDLRQGEPPRILRGFTRVWLKAGEKKMVTMQLLRRDISIWDVRKQDWVMGGKDGKINVEVGASSRDIRLTGNVVLSKHS